MKTNPNDATFATQAREALEKIKELDNGKSN